MRSRRLLIIATLAALLMACTDTGTGSAPPAPVTPSPTPSALATTSSTPANTLQPAATCPPDPSAVEASLDLGTSSGVVTIPLEPGVTVPTPSASISPIDPAEVPIEGTVLGGTEIRGNLRLDAGGIADTVITALTARFIPFDASPSAPIAVALDGASIRLTLPDKDADGRLWLAIDWNTSCGAGAGGGAIGLRVVDSSVAAGCPPTEEGLFDAVRALGKKQVSVATLNIPIGIVGWSGRWIDANGVDDVPQLAGFDPDDPIAASAPGASIVIRESIDDLDLLSVRAAIFRRADVLAYLEPDSNGEIDAVDVVRRSAGPLGRIGIPAPLDPGNYVIELQGQSQTSCLTLDTYEVVSIEVR